MSEASTQVSPKLMLVRQAAWWQPTWCDATGKMFSLVYSASEPTWNNDVAVPVFQDAHQTDPTNALLVGQNFRLHWSASLDVTAKPKLDLAYRHGRKDSFPIIVPVASEAPFELTTQMNSDHSSMLAITSSFGATSILVEWSESIAWKNATTRISGAGQSCLECVLQHQQGDRGRITFTWV